MQVIYLYYIFCKIYKQVNIMAFLYGEEMFYPGFPLLSKKFSHDFPWLIITFTYYWRPTYLHTFYKSAYSNLNVISVYNY